jgi:hypothetical protein
MAAVIESFRPISRNPARIALGSLSLILLVFGRRGIRLRLLLLLLLTLTLQSAFKMDGLCKGFFGHLAEPSRVSGERNGPRRFEAPRRESPQASYFIHVPPRGTMSHQVGKAFN